MPLADASVTEWRLKEQDVLNAAAMCHSLMLVLLNGGPPTPPAPHSTTNVPLADASVTEWRLQP